MGGRRTAAEAGEAEAERRTTAVAKEAKEVAALEARDGDSAVAATLGAALITCCCCCCCCWLAEGAACRCGMEKEEGGRDTEVEG